MKRQETVAADTFLAERIRQAASQVTACEIDVAAIRESDDGSVAWVDRLHKALSDLESAYAYLHAIEDIGRPASYYMVPATGAVFTADDIDTETSEAEREQMVPVAWDGAAWVEWTPEAESRGREAQHMVECQACGTTFEGDSIEAIYTAMIWHTLCGGCPRSGEGVVWEIKRAPERSITW